MDKVAELSQLRMLGALLVGVVGVFVWRQLRRSGWSEGQAAAIGAAIILLPGSQVVVGWAIAWPIALGLIAALAGFSSVERGFKARGVLRVTFVATGVALYFVAGLTYQTSALFAVVPLAAVLLMREGTTLRDDAYWVVAHIGLLFMSLVVGYVAMTVMFTEGVVYEAARMHIEPHPFIKLLWFARNPLPNSVALFALRDAIATPLWFWLVVAGVVALMLLGLLLGATTRQQRLRWLFVALLLPFVAHSVSLAASSQAIGYRTLLPLSGVFLVLAAFGFRAVAARVRLPRTAEATVLVVFLAFCAFVAHQNAFTLIAEPQGREWQLVKAAASRFQPTNDTRVYLIRPTSPQHRSTERLYADEFFIDAYVGAVEDRTDPDISPIFGDLRGLPAALLVIGTEDLVLEDSLAMAGRLAAAGGEVDLRVYPESPHGFLSFPIAMAAAANEDVESWLAARFAD